MQGKNGMNGYLSKLQNAWLLGQGFRPWGGGGGNISKTFNAFNIRKTDFKIMLTRKSSIKTVNIKYLDYGF